MPEQRLMTVTIDPLACGRSGYCVRIAPEVFVLESGGPARVRVSSPGVEVMDGVMEAEVVCPTGAIRVLDDDTDRGSPA